MLIFNKHPKMRLIFVFSNLIASLWVVFRDFALLNIFAAIPFIFCSYIALAKSEIIKNRSSASINTFLFDILSSVVLLYFIVDLIILFV